MNLELRMNYLYLWLLTCGVFAKRLNSKIKFRRYIVFYVWCMCSLATELQLYVDNSNFPTVMRERKSEREKEEREKLGIITDQ